MVCEITVNESFVTWAATYQIGCYKELVLIVLISYLCNIIWLSVFLANLLMMSHLLTFTHCWCGLLQHLNGEWPFFPQCLQVGKLCFVPLLIQWEWEPAFSFPLNFFVPLSSWFEWTFAGSAPSTDPSNLISLLCSCACK